MLLLCYVQRVVAGATWICMTIWRCLEMVCPSHLHTAFLLSNYIISELDTWMQLLCCFKWHTIFFPIYCRVDVNVNVNCVTKICQCKSSRQWFVITLKSFWKSMLFHYLQKSIFLHFFFNFIVSGVILVCLYKQTSLCICGGFSEMYPACY